MEGGWSPGNQLPSPSTSDPLFPICRSVPVYPSLEGTPPNRFPIGGGSTVALVSKRNPTCLGQTGLRSPSPLRRLDPGLAVVNTEIATQEWRHSTGCHRRISIPGACVPGPIDLVGGSDETRTVNVPTPVLTPPLPDPPVGLESRS